MALGGPVLILYSTIDGHTRLICERIGAHLQQAGATVSIEALEQSAPERIAAAGKVLIGASIRYGHHRPAVLRLLREARTLLEARHCALFSVNVVARKAAKSGVDTNPYLRKLLQRAGWRPRCLAVFAGRIDYPHCGWLDRQMIRLIMRITGGPTDVSRAWEFTDWNAVDAFAAGLAGAWSAGAPRA